MQKVPFTTENVSIAFEAKLEAKLASLVRRDKLPESEADKIIVLFCDALQNLRDAR